MYEMLLKYARALMADRQLLALLRFAAGRSQILSQRCKYLRSMQPGRHLDSASATSISHLIFIAAQHANGHRLPFHTHCQSRPKSPWSYLISALIVIKIGFLHAPGCQSDLWSGKLLRPATFQGSLSQQLLPGFSSFSSVLQFARF